MGASSLASSAPLMAITMYFSCIAQRSITEHNYLSGRSGELSIGYLKTVVHFIIKRFLNRLGAIKVYNWGWIPQAVKHI